MRFLSLFAAADFDDNIILKDFFWSEIMSVCKTGAYCGVRQIFPVAIVLGSNVRSVYPSLGEEPVHLMMNRTFHPSAGEARKTEALMSPTAGTCLRPSGWQTMLYLCYLCRILTCPGNLFKIFSVVVKFYHFLFSFFLRGTFLRINE